MFLLKFLKTSYLVQLLDGASAHQNSLDAFRRLRVDGLPNQESPVHLGEVDTKHERHHVPEKNLQSHTLVAQKRHVINS